ncbi:hypothetical protein NIIDMKKI_32350 [Mycobacterium kansasii]|uniref:Uncharacterized protein n=1 Tax=Mycobacterium kansasii TaxID=1768 RepID=A0A7G1IEN0_MYCKA|nr:hypothetical protein NIIDMKKI_32350 [Mycobacterium kansasii]
MSANVWAISYAGAAQSCNWRTISVSISPVQETTVALSGSVGWFCKCFNASVTSWSDALASIAPKWVASMAPGPPPLATRQPHWVNVRAMRATFA